MLTPEKTTHGEVTFKEKFRIIQPRSQSLDIVRGFTAGLNYSRYESLEWFVRESNDLLIVVGIPPGKDEVLYDEDFSEYEPVPVQ